MIHIIIIILMSWIHAKAFSIEIKGVARTTDQKSEIYYEVHKIELDSHGWNRFIDTKYYRPDGSLFATMQSDFSKNPKVPSVVFEDLRFKVKEEIQYYDSTSIVFKTSGSSTKSSPVKVAEDMVVGQGFDNFIKMNFDALTKRMSLLFGVLSERDFFSFESFREAGAKDGVVEIKVRLKGLIDLFVPSTRLSLEYDSRSKQLLKYTGLSNLKSDRGQKQVVVITYEAPKS